MGDKSTGSLAPLSTKDHIYLSLYWFSLSFHWGAMLAVVLPTEVLVRAPESNKVLYLRMGNRKGGRAQTCSPFLLLDRSILMAHGLLLALVDPTVFYFFTKA